MSLPAVVNRDPKRGAPAPLRILRRDGEQGRG